MRSLAIGMVVLMFTAPAAAGQRLPAAPAGSASMTIYHSAARGPLRAGLPADSLRGAIPRTHWKEGALIGGAAGGLALAYVVGSLCEAYSGDCGSSYVGAFVLGGGIGGVIGMLIGGQFPKTGGAEPTPREMRCCPPGRPVRDSTAPTSRDGLVPAPLD